MVKGGAIAALLVGGAAPADAVSRPSGTVVPNREALAAAGEAESVYVLGFASPGDGGGCRVRRVAGDLAAPAPGQFVASGLWEIDEDEPSLRMYGAGLGAADDRKTIQTAIDHLARRGGGVLRADPDTTYRLGIEPYRRFDGSVYGVYSLMCRDGVDLVGPRSAVFCLKDRMLGPGAFYRMFASDDETGLNDVELRGFTVDGAKEAQVPSDQCSNILLECRKNVTVRDVHSRNANGNGVMLRGRAGRVCRDIRVLDCLVEDCVKIGIQAAHFDGLDIRGNYVERTGDNSIDVYGDDGSNQPDSCNFVIAGNHVAHGLVGVFIETARDGRVHDNAIIAARSAGWMVNRIHGAPSGLLIYANTIRQCSRGGWFSGDMGPAVAAFCNDIADFTEAGAQFGAGGNVSHVHVFDNLFTPATRTTPIFRVERTTTAAFIYGYRNSVFMHEYDFGAAVDLAASRHVGVVFRDWIGVAGAPDHEHGVQTSGERLVIPCRGDGPCEIKISARLDGVGASMWTIQWARFGGHLFFDSAPRKLDSGFDPVQSCVIEGDAVALTLKDPRARCEWSSRPWLDR